MRILDHGRQLIPLSRARTRGDGLPPAGPGEPWIIYGHKSSKAGGSGRNCPGWELGGNAHYLITPDLQTKVVPINGVGGWGEL